MKVFTVSYGLGALRRGSLGGTSCRGQQRWQLRRSTPEPPTWRLSWRAWAWKWTRWPTATWRKLTFAGSSGPDSLPQKSASGSEKKRRQPNVGSGRPSAEWKAPCTGPETSRDISFDHILFLLSYTWVNLSFFYLYTRPSVLNLHYSCTSFALSLVLYIEYYRNFFLLWHILLILLAWIFLKNISNNYNKLYCNEFSS